MYLCEIFCDMKDLRDTIEKAWDQRELLKEAATQMAIRKVIDLLDQGAVRCAEPS